EGQIIVSRDLQRKGIYPPIDVLPSLSRLMSKGIGKDRTREDHKSVSDQLYAAYAEGKDLRGLVSIVGKESLSKSDKQFLEFADDFERLFVAQNSNENRKIEDTLDIAWKILSKLPEDKLLRVSDELIEKYMKGFKDASNKTDEI
ncbi:MAG: V-type ATP synthase subunit B, partial [Candidatus Methanofastidiosum sp.]|nr:V-type ATP synthase subunit B [Methanofastidiosum sp.]